MLCKFIRRFRKTLVCAALFVSFGNRTFAQEHGTYHSEADDLLTIEKVSVLPFTDNLQGIYARPIETHFISLVDKMHRWNYIASSTSGPIARRHGCSCGCLHPLRPESRRSSPPNRRRRHHSSPRPRRQRTSHIALSLQSKCRVKSARRHPHSTLTPNT